VLTRGVYLQLLHGELGAVLLGALHQDVQRVAVILPLGTQRLLPDGLLDAFLQGVSCADTLPDGQETEKLKQDVSKRSRPRDPVTLL